MHNTVMCRHQVIPVVSVLMLATAIAVSPSGRRIAQSAVFEFIQIPERLARFPCWLTDHRRCFSVDRFDPTCPQCM